MSYLSQFKVNPARRGAAKLLGSPQAMHAAVLAGFPVEDPGRVLWRVDRSARQQALLYVVSPLAPDFTHLVEQAGWPTTETWRTTSYDPFLNALEPGQHWRFRLTANPVRVDATAGGQRGKVRPHVTAAQQEAWLRAKAQSWGFEPLADAVGGVVASRRGVDSFSKGSQGRQVTLSRVQFDGQIEVRDVATLRRYLTEGMGRGKAYGCGLMTLAPVR